MDSQLIALIDIEKLLSEHGTMDVNCVLVLGILVLWDLLLLVIRELFDVVAPVIWLSL